MPTNSPKYRPVKHLTKPPHEYATTLLRDLLGASPSVAIVESPYDYPLDVLTAALTEVEQAVCPFPALAVRDWFWRCPAGRQLAQAQWIVYENEAVRVVKVAKMLYGDMTHMDLERVDRLFRRGLLPYYVMPSSFNVYCRRSAVLHLYQTNGHIIRQGHWWSAKYVTPEQVAAIRAEHPLYQWPDGKGSGLTEYMRQNAQGNTK